MGFLVKSPLLFRKTNVFPFGLFLSFLLKNDIFGKRSRDCLFVYKPERFIPFSFLSLFNKNMIIF